MKISPHPDTDELVAQASRGDPSARQRLLERHRPRLHRMVAVHLDRRLAARFDPSDVVQDALGKAAQKLSDFLRRRPLPFYPWLRQIAWDCLIELRRHLEAGKRTVTREEAGILNLPEESAVELAARLLDHGSSPSGHLLRQELRGRVQAALQRLAPRDREVLVLRHLEQLSTPVIAQVLGIGEGAVKSRHLRALQRLRVLLSSYLNEETP
jgi:RNA polymerase sigma-70 factor (ECF subfamily)